MSQSVLDSATWTPPKSTDGLRHRMRAFGIAVVAFTVAILVAVPATYPSSPSSGRPAPVGARASPAQAPVQVGPHVGLAPTDPLGEANAYNGSRGWVKGDVSGGPPAGEFQSIADDPGLGGVVFFGGTTRGGAPLNDTWEFAGGSWSEICNMTAVIPTCPTAPSPRIGSSMAYDPSLHQLILFGGCASSSDCLTLLNDTWALSAAGWVNVTPASPTASNTPPADAVGEMTYDAADGYLLMFGATGATWKYDSNGWTNLSPVQSPPARNGAALFYDTHSAAVILFGGATGAVDDTPLSDTWSFHAGNWTQQNLTSSPPAGVLNGYSYDTPAQYGVVFGLGNPGDYDSDQNYTWTWSDGSWTNQSANFGTPPPSSLNPMAMTFDSTDGVTVLLEPLPPHESTSATWILRDPLELSVNASASVVDVGGSLTYSVVGSGGFGAYRLAVSSLPPGCGVRNRVPAIIPCTVTASGTYIVNFTLADGSGLASTVSLPLQVNVDPLPTITVAPNPTTVGRPVSFVASYVGGTGAISARWTFGDGAGFIGNDTAHTYVKPGSYLARLSGVDGAGVAVDANVTVTVDFGIHAAASVNRNVTDVGFPTNFRASGFGGTGSLSFAWNFGNGGTAALSQYAYAYSAPGAYEPRVYVNDSVGASATANLSVDVNPLPTVTLGENASIVPAGSRVAFSAAVDGGTLPISYGWIFPDGTVNSSADATHLFGQVGTFTVRLVVHDAVGAAVVNSTVISVTALRYNGSTSNGSSGPPIWGGVGAVVIGGAVAAALALFANSRRLKVRRLER